MATMIPGKKATVRMPKKPGDAVARKHAQSRDGTTSKAVAKVAADETARAKTAVKSSGRRPVPESVKAGLPLAAGETSNHPAQPLAPVGSLATKTRPAAKNVAAKQAKPKDKLVRDSFTMPQVDFGLIAVLKARALQFRRPAKKSELLRAGLHALQALSDAELHAALDGLVTLQPGRPKKTG